MKRQEISEILQGNPYPGRGIVLGATPDGERAARLARHQRAGAVREQLGQHRLDEAGQVDRRAAPVGLAIDRRAGPHVGADVGDVNPDPAPPAAERLGGDRVVEVTGPVEDRHGAEELVAGERRVGRDSLDERRRDMPAAVADPHAARENRGPARARELDRGEDPVHGAFRDHRANVGDWIIKGVKGELYPCKPDIFEATYDLSG